MIVNIMIIDCYSVLSAQLLLGSYGSNYPIKRLPKKKKHARLCMRNDSEAAREAVYNRRRCQANNEDEGRLCGHILLLGYSVTVIVS